jgi:ABC-type transport system substrate-binding protein
MVAQLEAGTVNLVRTPPLTDVNRLRADPKFQVVLHDHSGVILGMGMSTYAPPLDDKRVRQALNYAIDRKRIVPNLRGLTPNYHNSLNLTNTWVDA